MIFFQFLEHEKQRLRGQLELMEDEYEQRILELQTDIDTLKAKLNDSGDSDSRLRERSNLVAQLVSQIKASSQSDVCQFILILCNNLLIFVNSKNMD